MMLNEEGRVEVLVTYNLLARSKGSRKAFLRIKCEYDLVYESAERLPQEFFEMYSKTSLPLNVWPYFREFVQSTSTRMGLPPITMPLFKTLPASIRKD